MCETLGRVNRVFQKLCRVNRTAQKEKAMNEMTQVISEVKAEVSREEWEQRILACQQSGMSVRSWCRENGVTTGSYYHYLRKLRESMLTEKEIVPLKKPRPTASEGIRIESGEIRITVSENVSPEMVAVILSALKSC